ncbi:uncharacterized protein [Periplaneta americana]|uniref:uncharacterized protein isoform X1 n=1 Tax=Periplaneta americana TaxID=6978 RepID=UPI0037E764F7
MLFNVILSLHCLTGSVETKTDNLTALDGNDEVDEDNILHLKELPFYHSDYTEPDTAQEIQTEAANDTTGCEVCVEPIVIVLTQASTQTSESAFCEAEHETTEYKLPEKIMIHAATQTDGGRDPDSRERDELKLKHWQHIMRVAKPQDLRNRFGAIEVIGTLGSEEYMPVIPNMQSAMPDSEDRPKCTSIWAFRMPDSMPDSEDKPKCASIWEYCMPDSMPDSEDRPKCASIWAFRMPDSMLDSEDRPKCTSI